MQTILRRTTIVVRDIDKSITFYRDAVGLRVGWSSGPHSHEADSTPKVAPAGGHADGRAAVLRYTPCSNAVPDSSGT